MKRLPVLSVLLAAAMILAACAPAASTAAPAGTPVPKQIKIGMVNYTLSAAYFVGMDKAVHAEAANYSNVTVLSTDAGGDAAKLTSDTEDLVAKGVSGIIISGGPLESAPEALAAIKKAGIPVVLVDRQFKGGDYTAYVGPENYTIGQEDGQFIVDQLKGQGGTVVDIRGGPADNTIGLDRTNGMLSIVKPVSNINVVYAAGWGNWDTNDGLTVMEDALTKNPKIAAVFCENDSMCLGAQQAIANANRSSEMFLVAVDGQKEALLQIKNGSNYKATGLNNSGTIGADGFNRLMGILAGGQSVHDTILPSPLITIDNVAKFYDPNAIF
ncbi:MAG: substrate-binding domain-containing protein [Anaerolineales bacterium]|jgi:ABC-type sugar transport system substrate-binding protein